MGPSKCISLDDLPVWVFSLLLIQQRIDSVKVGEWLLSVLEVVSLL